MLMPFGAFLWVIMGSTCDWGFNGFLLLIAPLFGC